MGNNDKMKALLVVFSYHHKNTEKIAKAIAKVLDAQIKTPEQVDSEKLQQYDLIGFGAGIAGEKHYQRFRPEFDYLFQVDADR